jgi:alanyl-tRNA synthetase
VQKAIDGKLEIDTKECSLAEARAICSLRAVFGEKYPDPVRVVSIGQEIGAMIGTPDNEEWKAFSVEFCGGTHLTNATQAGKFLITSEEPVSKGVRRINAVTGKHADVVLEEYAEINARVDACGSMEGAEKLKEAKLLQTRVEAATLHVAGKAELTDKLKKVRKDLLAFEKAEMKKKMEKALKDAADLIAKLKGGVEKSVVLKFAGDKTVASEVVNLFQKDLPDVAVFALAEDEVADQLCCITLTPEALQGTLPANEWCNAGMTVASGKGGGKKDRAQGNAKGRTASNKVCEAAAICAHDKLSNATL